MRVTIVMPVYNNQEIINRSIPSFFEQSLEPREYELIVINDGSTDNTSHVLHKLRNQYPFRLIEQENQGPAKARNRGIQRANFPVILFTQDDIIADRDLLKMHFEFHNQHPELNYAMIGYITWHSELKITPFMHWLEHGGPQFDFDRLRHGQTTDYLAFYTPNLSVKKEFLQKHGGFDENFYVRSGITAYEDTELGWRLYQDGMKLIYQPEGIASHYHPKNLASVLKRRFYEGQILHLLYQKHPDFTFAPQKESILHRITHLKTDFIPDKWRYKLTKLFMNRFTVWPLEKLAYFLEDKINTPLLYKLVCGYHYNRGIGSTKSKCQISK